LQWRYSSYPKGYWGSKGSLPLALGEPPEAVANRGVTGHQYITEVKLESKTGNSLEMGKTILKVKEIVKSITKNDGIDHVTDEENFIESLGLSSIQVIMLIAKVENEFNIPFGENIDDIDSIQSCREISKTIVEKLNQGVNDDYSLSAHH
jgi:acyl carrier protein